MSTIFYKGMQISELLSSDQQYRAAVIFELQHYLGFEEQRVRHRKERDELLATHRSEIADAIHDLRGGKPVDAPLLIRTHEEYFNSMTEQHEAEKEAYYFQLKQEYIEYVRNMIADKETAT